MDEPKPSAERRKTAGLRGASWNPELLPADMRSSVHVMATADGAQVLGYLHARGGENTAVMIMHPRELLVSHYMVPYLVGAGVACWVQGPRTVGNDLRLEHELALHDVAAGMVRLRELGFARIVLLGNSGGAPLFAFYNQQSLREGAHRIERTPGGRPTRLAEATMPAADGFIFIAPHPGQGKLLLNMIDPSVTDESDPLSIDPELDPFSAANGFRAAPDSAQYSDGFIARYRAAQRQRVERLDGFARSLIAARQDARKRLKAGDAAAALPAALSGVFEVWRTDADLRSFDLRLDPSDRRWGSVWGAEPLASNLGSVGFARVCTPESWLSTWSGLSSNASFERCGSAIGQPAITIEYTGDNSVFPSDLDGIAETIGSGDRVRHRLRGNHHGQPLAGDEESGQQIAGALIVDWMRSRFAGGRAAHA